MNAYQVSQPSMKSFTPRQTRGAMNEQLAQAHAEADQRYNMKPMDRAGMSRGGAQQHMAGISAAQNLAQGVARAYSQEQQDALANATNSQSAETLGQDMNALAMQAQYADLLSRLQRQSTLQQNALGGLLGNNLDSFLGF